MIAPVYLTRLAIIPRNRICCVCMCGIIMRNLDQVALPMTPDILLRTIYRQETLHIFLWLVVMANNKSNKNNHAKTRKMLIGNGAHNHSVWGDAHITLSCCYIKSQHHLSYIIFAIFEVNLLYLVWLRWCVFDMGINNKLLYLLY